MRCIVAAFVVIAAATAGAGSARADNGPVIVIPTRPGVPVNIHGLDASYMVVEGDWGLSRPGHGSITIIGDAPAIWYGPRSSYYPRYGRPPPRGRNEIELGPDRPMPEPAEPYFRSWSSDSAPAVNFYGVPRRPANYQAANDGMPPATITDPETFSQPASGGLIDGRRHDGRRRNERHNHHRHHHRRYHTQRHR